MLWFKSVEMHEVFETQAHMPECIDARAHECMHPDACMHDITYGHISHLIHKHLNCSTDITTVHQNEPNKSTDLADARAGGARFNRGGGAGLGIVVRCQHGARRGAVGCCIHVKLARRVPVHYALL